jgi:hypothetical protein
MWLSNRPWSADGCGLRSKGPTLPGCEDARGELLGNRLGRSMCAEALLRRTRSGRDFSNADLITTATRDLEDARAAFSVLPLGVSFSERPVERKSPCSGVLTGQLRRDANENA